MQSNSLLAEVKKQTIHLKNTAEEHFLPLNQEKLSKKPSANKWSIAECLEHLNRYSRYYNKAIEVAILKAKDKKWLSTSDFTSSWLGKKSIASVHPDNQKPMKTQKFLNPANSKISEEVVKEFISHQETFLELIELARPISLQKPKIPIEVMKLLKMRLGDVFLFMVAHHQRHCNQALRIVEASANAS